jgi:hypothetical protein
MLWPNNISPGLPSAHQSVGKMAKSANFGFCALPMNRIITKAKLSRLRGLNRLDV